MHHFLWLVPLAIIALGVWLATLVPQAALAVIGFIALCLLPVAAAAWLVMWFWAESMRT